MSKEKHPFTSRKVAFLTEAGAREAARREWTNDQIVIVYSPHQLNPSDEQGRGDYFIEPAGGMIRTGETVLFNGRGGLSLWDKNIRRVSLPK